MLFSKAIEGYLLDCQASGFSPRTVELNGLCVRRLLGYTGDVEIATIDTDQLKRFFVWLQNDYKPVRSGGNITPLAPASIDAHWKAMRSFYRWAAEVLKLSRPDMNISQPKYKPPVIVPFTEDEIRQMITACEHRRVKPKTRAAYESLRHTADRDHALILILVDTGLRVGELSRLTWADANLATGDLLVTPYRSSIKSRPRQVIMSKKTLRALWKYSTTTDCAPNKLIFGISVEALKSLITRIGTRANVNHCHPHRFRHTFAITYLRNGGDVFTLQRLLGHADLKMTMRYVNLIQTDLEAAHRRASPVDNWRL